MIRNYYQLAKPGIIYGNSITAIAGFFLATGSIFSGHSNWLLLIAMLLGLGFIMGGACVWNNCLDRDIDVRMDRTKTRATVSGSISLRNAWVYGSVLLLLGANILFFFTNILALFVALFGTLVYVCIYTPLKRRTIYSTLVGALAGATPPVVGFVAVTNTFNAEALLLFLILFFWQMPHFYAIAIYRQSEYEAAGIPLLPMMKGIRKTKIHMLVYICAYVVTTALLGFLYVTNHIYMYIYLAVMALLGMIWLYAAMTGFYPQSDDVKWARKMFFLSLIIITLWSILMI
jgi:protoheme IX farnesyltransferase